MTRSGGTMIFEGLQLSCGMSCMVERDGFGMTLMP